MQFDGNFCFRHLLVLKHSDSSLRRHFRVVKEFTGINWNVDLIFTREICPFPHGFGHLWTVGWEYQFSWSVVSSKITRSSCKNSTLIRSNLMEIAAKPTISFRSANFSSKVFPTSRTKTLSGSRASEVNSVIEKSCTEQLERAPELYEEKIDMAIYDRQVAGITPLLVLRQEQDSVWNIPCPPGNRRQTHLTVQTFLVSIIN